MIHHGDLFDVLPTLDADSIDACVTDPPYGIGFMGKSWDGKAIESSAKRFNTRNVRPDTGKVYNQSIGEKASLHACEYDRSLEGLRAFEYWCEMWAREVLRVLKPGGYLLICGAPRSFHRMTCGIEDAGFEIRDCLSWLYGQGFPKSLNLPGGRGTALKPSWEPIILARKPVHGTVAQNVERHGTAALNIDACRIEGVPPSVPQPVFNSPTGRTYGMKTGEGRNGEMSQSDLGRWPANVLLDEEAAAMLDEQTGDLVSGGSETASDRTDSVYADGLKRRMIVPRFDTGGASRFVYVAKPSREERNFGCGALEAQQAQGVHPGIINKTAQSGVQKRFERRNHHPTVKPVGLMRYLVKLVTPIGGIVLDPFTGSGTTGMACRYEQRAFIGIEREAEYVAIAEARIAAVAPLFGDPAQVEAEITAAEQAVLFP